MIECVASAVNSSGIFFDATAGETYFFMVGSSSGGPGGNLVFNVVDMSPFDLEVSIDPTGKVSPSTGLATVSGTVSCSEDSSFLNVFGDVTQRAGRANITASFAESIFCAGGEEPTSWSFTFEGQNGRFVGGRASVTVSAFGCDIDETCDEDQESKTVQLRGSG